MPRNLIRVTVDLEGKIKKYGTNRRVTAVPLGDPVIVEVPCELLSIPHKKYEKLAHHAVHKSKDRPPAATAYATGYLMMDSIVYIPVQFYRVNK